MVAEHEEAGSREIRVELDQDDVGGGVDRLQGRVAAELADLRGRLVRTVPGLAAEREKKKKNNQRVMLAAQTQLATPRTLMARRNR